MLAYLMCDLCLFEGFHWPSVYVLVLLESRWCIDNVTPPSGNLGRAIHVSGSQAKRLPLLNIPHFPHEETLRLRYHPFT